MPRAPVGSGCPVSSKKRGKCRSQTGCGSAPVLKQKKKQPKKNGGFNAVENGKNQPKVAKKSKKVQRIKQENAGTPDENFEGDGNHGWSKEQEMKLRNAYLLVKVSPNFWKEIAKQVPGKTAKECFDKFYSDNPTPEAEKTKARRGSATSPIKTLSNFLSPSRLIVRTKSRFAGGKRGLINSHKTVREILRKRQTSDREYEEDAFEALQSQTISATSQSPGPSAETPASSTSNSRQGSRIRSRLGSMSPLSGIVCSKDSISESPEVLKHIKDPKQHDRYLDLLISRQQQSKRYKEDSSKNKRAACSSFSRMLKDVVAARAAVLGDAHDVLKKALTAQSLEQDHCMEDEDDNDIESDKEDLDV